MSAPVVISGGKAVGVTTAPYAAMREYATEVSRALEDQQWDNLGTDQRRADAPYEERKALIERSRLFCRRHPLAKQATKLLVNYVLGGGITLRANDKGKVARLVDEMWDNPTNQEVFTSQAAMADVLRGIFSDGDVFLVLFPDEEQGTLELGIIDALYVEDIVGDPQNWKIPKWYKVRKPQGRYDFVSGTWVPETTADFVWYRDWRNKGEDDSKPPDAVEDEEEEEKPKPKRKRKAKVKEAAVNSTAPSAIENGLVYHVAINRRGLFGEPETAAALDWLKAHKNFMEDRATINRAASQIAWRKKQKGTVASVQAEAARLQSRLSAAAAGWDTNPPPASASTVVENENSTMDWMRTDTGGAAATNDERLLRMLVGSGMGGIPNHIFGDEAQANLATATAMGTPMHKAYEQWQQLLAGIIDDLMMFYFELCHEAGRLGPRDDTAKYEDQRTETARKVLDKPESDPQGPRQLTSGRPTSAGRMAEHGSKDRDDYYKYHPNSKGGPGRVTQTPYAQRVDDEDNPDENKYQPTDEKYFLDDGKWDDERVAIHDQYVREVQDGVPTTDEPVVYLIAGGTAAGKSTTSKTHPELIGIPPHDQLAVVNPDHAKEMLPEYRAAIAEQYKGAARLAHEESSHMSKRALYESLQNSHSVLYDAVGDSGVDRLAEKVQDMREHGAKQVIADYFTVPVEIAVQRAIARATDPTSPDFGRHIDASVIREFYKDIPGTVAAAAKRGIFDQMHVWDNHKPSKESPPVLLATYEQGGELVIVNQEGWDKFQATGFKESGRPLFAEHGSPSDPNYARDFHPGGEGGEAIPLTDYFSPIFHGASSDLPIGAIIEPRSKKVAHAAAHVSTARVFAGPDGYVYEVEPVNVASVWRQRMQHTGNETHYEILSPDGFRIVAKLPKSRRDSYYNGKRTLVRGRDRAPGILRPEDVGTRYQEHGDPADPGYAAKYHPGPDGPLRLNTGGAYWSGSTDDPADMGSMVPGSGEHDEGAGAKIAQKERTFQAQGGKVHEMTGMADAETALISLHEMDRAMGDNWLGNLGPKFTRSALGSARSGDKVLIAIDAEGIAGALSWDDLSDQFMELKVLGTTGITDGTGSGLTAWALRRAFSHDQGIRLQPIGDAVPFWTTMGMHPIAGTKYWGMSADEVRSTVEALDG